MRSDDWPVVRAIYLEGIATGDATFEQSPPDWEKWDTGHLLAARIVGRSEGGDVLGWAALSAVSGRCVYAGVAEVSVYVAQRARGRGVGRQLLARLIADSEADGVWTLQAGIFPENVASIALHERAGFRMVGKRERLGQMNGRWRDVVLMERRSAVAGQ
ncbi:MAG: N-acetyltransferase family protein [Bryobacteraceae bacterium]|jgi:phosphinothricin acetyltransferase